MSSIAKHPESRFWHAFFRDAKGRQHSVSTKIEHTPSGSTPKDTAKRAADNRRLAQDVANRLEEAERGNPTEVHLRKLLDDLSNRVNKQHLEFKRTKIFLDEWAERADKAKSWRTGLRYKKVIADFLDCLGPKADAAINDVTPRDIQKFVDSETAAGKSGSSIRIAAKVLNIPFNLARRQGLILTNPVPSVELPDAANENRSAFSWEQVVEILSVAKGEWKTCIMVAVFTGARLGDCVALRWSNFDLPKKLLTFRPSKTKRKKVDLVVPIHPTLDEHLLSLPCGDDPKALVMPGLAAQQIPGRSGLSRQFQDVMREASIEQDTVAAAGKGGRIFNRFSFHSLRHTYVSQLANAGIAPDVRQLLAGHADERSHAIYTHTQLVTLRSAIEALPKIP
jgi:integrase